MRGVWLFLLILLMALAPMLISLGKPGPQHNMEGLALATSQETWMRQHQGESGAWLLPTQNGQVRVRKPPMLVWLNMLAWTGLDPATADPRQLILRARLVSVGLAVVMILATYWIGCTLSLRESPNSRSSGLLAAMIVGTMLLTQQQARMASYDMHLAAWATLSVAAALWAISDQSTRPVQRRVNRRFIIGWSIAGVGLALSFMSKNPLALLLVAIPVCAAMALDARRRTLNLFGLLACMILAAALIVPWYAYLFFKQPEAWQTIWHEIGASYTNHQPLYYYPLELLKLSLPWTLWMVAGLVLPFVTHDAPLRRAGLIPWLWFVSLLVLFSISPGKASRYILPIAPAVALLAASVWREHQLLAQRAESDPGMRWLTIPHWVGLLAVSLGFGLFLAQQERFVEWGWLDSNVVGVLSRQAAVGVTIALVSVWTLGAWWQRRARIFRAALATAIWTAIASTVYWHADARALKKADYYEFQSRQVAQIIGEAPMAYLANSYADHPDYDFLFFLRRVVPPVKVHHLAKYQADRAEAFIMAEAGEKNDQAMQAAGYELIGQFEDGPRHHRALWRKRSLGPLH